MEIQLFLRKMRPLIIILAMACLPAPPYAFARTFTLEETIREALLKSYALMQNKEETAAKIALKNAARSALFPVFSAGYEFTHLDEEQSSSLIGVTVPQDEYIMRVSVTQPLFTGFSLITDYEKAKLGVDASGAEKDRVESHVVYQAKEAFYQVLKTEKLHLVSLQATQQLEAHEKVSGNFYDVGMIPRNDLLETRVELANARQEEEVARNNLEYAKASFNILLQREMNEAVDLVAPEGFVPFDKTLDACIQTAKESRSDLKAAQIQTEIAQKNVQSAKSEWYPRVDISATYYRVGTDPAADGGEGISDPDGWQVAAKMGWEFFNWGKTGYQTEEKTRRLMQARISEKQLLDTILLEVKNAYLKTKEAEINIRTAETAMRQARENLRISQERYKEQVASSTDVLDARTLLTKTETRYYNALYDHSISRALLLKAMGKMN